MKEVIKTLLVILMWAIAFYAIYLCMFYMMLG